MNKLEEEIQKIIIQIQNQIKIILKEYNSYKKYYYKKNYKKPDKYYIYDDEIIEGENFLDCLNESFERNTLILKECVKLYDLNNKINEKINEFLIPIFNERNQLNDELNFILSNLNNLTFL